MLPFSIDCRVEFEDVDSYGIAHHSRLINFLERARVRFLHERGVGVGDGSFQLVLMDLQVKFRQSAKIMDTLRVELSVGEIKSASLIWIYKIKSGDRPILDAQIKMASVTPAMKPTRFPESIRVILESIKSDESLAHC